MTFVDEGDFTVHLCASLATFWNTLSKQIEQLKKSMTRGPNETCAKRRRESKYWVREKNLIYSPSLIS